MKLHYLVFSLLLSTALSSQSLFYQEVNALLDPSLKPFYFGVASGDPGQNQVVIWTKLWNDNTTPALIYWEMATDTLLKQVVASGTITTDVESAYTANVMVTGLQPGNTYFYRFKYQNFYSPIGRTKTAPVMADSLRFAVVSCSHYEAGYFNAYRLLAFRNDLDAVIHLGDYIYEGSYAQSKKPGVRQHIPPHEIISLQDYRSRYAQYRLDKDLQEVHRLHPFIVEWDDHEFANNCYKEGAGNHQSAEGDWEERKMRARKVYFEWMPITQNTKESIIRSISYGNLAELFMLDGRIEGRYRQCDNPYDTLLSSVDRTMLGKEQSNWLVNGIKNSTARWKIIGNQVIFSEVDAHKLSKKYALNTDAWDGYPIERKAIFDSLYSYNSKNIIVITGDIHTSWALDLVQNPRQSDYYNAKNGKGVIGAEFVTPSITSGNLSSRLPKGLAKFIGSLLKRKSTNPHLRYLNVVDHGCMLLDVNSEIAKATWYFCKTVLKKTDKYKATKSWVTVFNSNRLVKTR